MTGSVKMFSDDWFKVEWRKLGFHYELHPGKTSWAGHQQQFRFWQVNLRGYLEVADAMNCKGYPSDAWEWATKPVPTQPAPR